MKYLFMFLLATFSCDGKITVETDGTKTPTQKIPEINEDVTGVAKVGARRLSRNEYNLSVASILGREILGAQGEPASAFPEDNVASLQYTMAQSHMNMFSLTGVPWDLHEVGHASNDTSKVSDCIAWHTKHWARLVQKFAETEEAGKSMLDNSVILYLCEGGKGYDPQGDKGQSTHSTENMCMLVAGHAGGLNAGIHLDGKKSHPGQALISCMNAVGVQTDTLGEVSGELEGLRTQT